MSLAAGQDNGEKATPSICCAWTSYCAPPGLHPGIGAITASAIVAVIGDGRMFKCGRDFVAWLGLPIVGPSRSNLGGADRRNN